MRARSCCCPRAEDQATHEECRAFRRLDDYAGTSEVDGNSFTRDEQIAKLALTVETAEESGADRMAGQSPAWSMHIVLPSLSLNHAARPMPSSEAISPSHWTPGRS